MKCPKCNTDNPNDAGQCKECGECLSDVAVTIKGENEMLTGDADSHQPVGAPDSGSTGMVVVAAQVLESPEQPAPTRAANMEYDAEATSAQSIMVSHVSLDEDGENDENQQVLGNSSGGTFESVDSLATQLTPDEADGAPESQNREQQVLECLPVSGDEGKLPNQLEKDFLIAGRFAVVEVVAEGSGRRTYLATDEQTCPICDQTELDPNEGFCPECGCYLPSVQRASVWIEEASLSFAESPSEEVWIEREYTYRVVPPPETESNDLSDAHLWKVRVGQATDPGRVRDLNEDSVSCVAIWRRHHDRNRFAGLFIVADGMGGHDGGEVASAITVDQIQDSLTTGILLPFLAGTRESEPDTICQEIVTAIQTCNRRVFEAALRANSDMGSTISLVLVLNCTIFVANVGDSRTYVYGDGGLQQITVDHSSVARMIAAGVASPDAIYTHPDRNVIYRGVGIAPTIEVDTWVRPYATSIDIILCTDGLWEFTRDEGIENAMLLGLDPQEACDELVIRANQGGGEDNISVVVVGLRI